MPAVPLARYFVVLKDGSRVDTGCTLMVNDRGVLTFHQQKVDGEKTGAMYAFAPGAWRTVEWANK